MPGVSALRGERTTDVDGGFIDVQANAAARPRQTRVGVEAGGYMTMSFDMSTAVTQSGQSERIDLFWSFRSHYCYLGLDRILSLEQEFPVTIRIRPVYPIAIRNPEFFSQQPRDPMRWRYIVRDAERIAESLSLPFAWPDPDPVCMNMQTLEIAAEQPYIFRLTGLAMVADRHGRCLEFTTDIARLIWGGTRGWDRGDHLAEAARRSGLELAVLDQEWARNKRRCDKAIKANERALAQAGHWGVPTLVFRGEAFFGQDRIDLCRWRMQQQGLQAGA
jgi:2-hydroxychromene-2-carboxylate isomerase